MPEGAIEQLLNLGVAGIALIALGWYSFVQHKALRGVEEARVNDQKAIVERLIALVEKQTLVAEGQRALLAEIRQELSERERDDGDRG